MPKISGNSLGNIIMKNKSQFNIYLYNSTIIYLPKIPVNKIIDICNSLITVFYQIDQLNKNNIYHNDLHMGNIMYDEKTKISTIIDFEMVTFDNPRNDFVNDKSNKTLYDTDIMVINIKYFLLCGILNLDTFYDQLIESQIIIKPGILNINIFIEDKYIFIDKLKELIN